MLFKLGRNWVELILILVRKLRVDHVATPYVRSITHGVTLMLEIYAAYVASTVLKHVVWDECRSALSCQALSLIAGRAARNRWHVVHSPVGDLRE